MSIRINDIAPDFTAASTAGEIKFHDWLDGSYARQIAPQDLSESLYLYYRQRLNMWISQVEDSVSVRPVPDWRPPGFAPAPGVPVGYFERIGFDQDNRRSEFSRNWFDPALARYVARIR